MVSMQLHVWTAHPGVDGTMKVQVPVGHAGQRGLKGSLPLLGLVDSGL